MKRTIHRLAAIAAVGTIALAGCASTDSDESGGGSDSSRQPSTMSTTQADEQSDGDEESESGDSAADDASDTGSSDSMKDPAGTHIARTAGLTVAVKDVEQASAKVRSAATGAGGYVSSEETRITDEDGSARSSSSSSSDITPPTTSGPWAQIVVTVPVDELDPTIKELAKVGTVTQRTSDAEDLTKQYTDTSARVRSMKKSVARLRALIDDTEDLEQIVTLEDELSEREADLESMVSQQKSLEKRTTTAPITVSLISSEATEEVADDESTTGFVTGLKGGWDAFTTALAGALTALGAITPFAVTGLVVLGPIAWWLRRRTRRTSADAG